MAKIVNSIDGARLQELNSFKAMLSDDYLYDEENLQTKFLVEQFFGADAAKKNDRLRLLNISYSIPSLISDKFSDYVGQPSMDMDVDIEDFVSAFIWGGYAVFNASIVNNEFAVGYNYPYEYIKDSDGSERILTYINVVDDNDNIVQYVLVQTYEGGFVANKLYKVNSVLGVSKANAINGTQVPLETLDATRGLPDQEFLELNRSPLVLVHNKRIKSRVYGTSEINRVKSLISSIEVEVVNIQDNFLKHLSSILALPATRLKRDEDGKINLNEIKAVAMEAGESAPQYVMNTNPLIKDSFHQIQDMLRQICAILSIPTEFMGLESPGGAESADAKRIRMTSFIKKVEKIRKKFGDGLIELDEIRRQWFGGDAEEFIITWPDIFPEDPVRVLDQLSKAQDASLITNKKAIMRFQDITEEEALAEQDEIMLEKAKFNPETNEAAVEQD